ncbi:MAG: hypothetical protein FWE76_07805, partial [Symbiobacteriaceae bacterium]|nr:hypothetical protein [Symbiobacteriaceae bacterium]
LVYIIQGKGAYALRITESQVRTLLTDNAPRQFTQLGFSLLVTRMKELYKADPSSASLQRCTQDLNAFISKFEVIMQQDIAILNRL